MDLMDNCRDMDITSPNDGALRTANTFCVVKDRSTCFYTSSVASFYSLTLPD
jgi:hypothetical protein